MRAEQPLKRSYQTTLAGWFLAWSCQTCIGDCKSSIRKHEIDLSEFSPEHFPPAFGSRLSLRVLRRFCAIECGVDSSELYSAHIVDTAAVLIGYLTDGGRRPNALACK